MKIIKEGDIRKSREVKTFECAACECIFEADSSEYAQTGWSYTQRELTCICPTCRREVVISEAVSGQEQHTEPVEENRTASRRK